jgi:hypothetical protein
MASASRRFFAAMAPKTATVIIPPIISTAMSQTDDSFMRRFVT